MHLIWTILIGFVVGLVARFLKPGKDKLGFIMTTLLGIGGALLAKFVGQHLGWYAPNQTAGFLAAVGGAIVLLVLYNMIVRRKS